MGDTGIYQQKKDVGINNSYTFTETGNYQTIEKYRKSTSLSMKYENKYWNTSYSNKGIVAI
jgi:hypothetical protein